MKEFKSEGATAFPCQGVAQLRTAFFSGMAAQQEQRKAIAQTSDAAALPCWAKFLWQDPAIGNCDQLAQVDL